MNATLTPSRSYSFDVRTHWRSKQRQLSFPIRLPARFSFRGRLDRAAVRDLPAFQRSSCDGRSGLVALQGGFTQPPAKCAPAPDSQPSAVTETSAGAERQGEALPLCPSSAYGQVRPPLQVMPNWSAILAVAWGYLPPHGPGMQLSDHLAQQSQVPPRGMSPSAASMPKNAM
jgi:hypothetical protein